LGKVARVVLHEPDDLAVDGARNAVLKLQVHLGDRVLGEDGGIGDIPDGGRLDHVADGEPLDGLYDVVSMDVEIEESRIEGREMMMDSGIRKTTTMRAYLVLGGAAGAVGAAHRLDVAAAILVATAKKSISSLAPIVANRSNPVSHSCLPAMCGSRGFDVRIVCACSSLRRC
jgi:hypothetical protein